MSTIDELQIEKRSMELEIAQFVQERVKYLKDKFGVEVSDVGIQIFPNHRVGQKAPDPLVGGVHIRVEV